MTSVFIVFTSFLSWHPANVSGMGAAGCKKGPVFLRSFRLGRTIETKAFTYTAHRVWNTPRYHFVCCTGQPLPAYIHTQPRNVGKTAMHYWKAGSAPLFTQAARRGERFAPDCCPCIRWAALWERVLQRIMSCSSHLPNDCPYFSAEFTNCQYHWNKFGGYTNSGKCSAIIFR